jgi:hypothetical protein
MCEFVQSVFLLSSRINIIPYENKHEIITVLIIIIEVSLRTESLVRLSCLE